MRQAPARNPLAPRSRRGVPCARGGSRVDWGDSYFWIAVGLLGNAAFALRFLVQWIASERAHRSVVPVSFWYLSLLGAGILLCYAIHRRDPIFVLAYLPNGFIYARNLYLMRRRQD
jgi:lipid-A-disaccharide synthase-like uncharacterized protein